MNALPGHTAAEHRLWREDHAKDKSSNPLAARAATAAWALTECAKRRGDLTEALEWAFRLLAINPDDERALREVIVLLDQLGDRIAALRMYRDFSHRIAADYGMEPAPETEVLISAIRTRDRRAIRA